jgi:hypothetical protein
MTTQNMRTAVLIALLLCTGLFFFNRQNGANASANRGGGRNGSINYVGY